MLQDLNQKLETIKKFFCTMINDVKGEVFTSIINEKDQNMSNIKTHLEEQLIKLKEPGDQNQQELKQTKQSEQTFIDFFEFFDNFKEECFNLIVSKTQNLNVEQLKRHLQNFKTNNLDGLYIPPKVFTTNLFRSFETENKSILGSKKVEVKQYGDVFHLDHPSADSASFSQIHSYDPLLNSKSKTPMIQIINSKYMIVVTRDKFRIINY